MSAVAGSVAVAALLVIGAFHVLWVRSSWPFATRQEFGRNLVGRPDGDLPTTFARQSLGVAALLVAAAFLVAAKADLVPGWHPRGTHHRRRMGRRRRPVGTWYRGPRAVWARARRGPGALPTPRPAGVLAPVPRPRDADRGGRRHCRLTCASTPSEARTASTLTRISSRTDRTASTSLPPGESSRTAPG